MPAKSSAQAVAARIALAVKHGHLPASKLKGASKQMSKMPTSSLSEFAHTKSGNLPHHVKK